MQARLDPRKAAPEAMKAMSNLRAYVGKCGLDHNLLELVKLRASQINSCAWCIDMHTKELRAAGESEQPVLQRARACRTWLDGGPDGAY
jgi:AhpD family alkylhydroperoxidase